MGLFKSKYETQMDIIIERMQMNMSNNYKDNAQANLRELEESIKLIKDNGLLNDKKLKRYEEILSVYKTKLQGYTHKDQKPFWT